MIEALDELRKELGDIDMDIIAKLAERFECCKRIGKIKATHGMPILDRQQELKQLALYREAAKKSGLDEAFISRLFELMMMYSKTIQNSSNETSLNQ